MLGTVVASLIDGAADSTAHFFDNVVAFGQGYGPITDLIGVSDFGDLGGDPTDFIVSDHNIFDTSIVTPVGTTVISSDDSTDVADAGFVDANNGNIRLNQIAAGQVSDLVAVDAGSRTAAAAGLDALTTRSDELPDTGVVDAGYHYTVSSNFTLPVSRAVVVDTAANPPTVTGQVISGSTVTVYLNDEEYDLFESVGVEAAVADSDYTTFTYTFSDPLAAGTYELYLTATDPVGHVSLASDTVSFTIAADDNSDNNNDDDQDDDTDNNDDSLPNDDSDTISNPTPDAESDSTDDTIETELPATGFSLNSVVYFFRLIGFLL